MASLLLDILYLLPQTWVVWLGDCLVLAHPLEEEAAAEEDLLPSQTQAWEAEAEAAVVVRA